MRFNAEKIVVKYTDKNNKSYHAKYNKDLDKRYFLNVVFVFYIANLSWAVLRFFLVKHVVEQATQANTKGRLEKQKSQTDKTNNASNWAIGINNNHQHKHCCRENYANNPCKFLLCRTNIFRVLPANNPPTNDKCWGEFWVDKHPNDEIHHKGGNHIFYHHKIAFKQNH